ncbi:MAG: NAD-dependent epimerase/dehydratase family protein [Rhizobiaceae bacterium]|nr:NAD-dependent epimerase/dehydratase family protein [Rhizobiaceae bacterium]
MTDQKTALVTGSNGFLGRHTVEVLEAAGWRVLSSGRSQLEGRPLDVHLDISSPSNVMRSLDNVEFDAIIHLAARIGWPDKTETELFVPNVLATGCLAEIARERRAKLVVASAAIIHGVRNTSITSASPETADTPYGRSKLLGDKLVQASGAAHCIIRFGGLFGLNGPAHLGLNKAISGILQGEPPVIVGTGTARRNYLYVKDAAKSVDVVLKHDIEGVHLYAGREALPIGAMLQTACDVLESGLKPERRDGGEAADQIIEPSTALPPSRSFEEALRDIRIEHLRCA